MRRSLNPPCHSRSNTNSIPCDTTSRPTNSPNSNSNPRTAAKYHPPATHHKDHNPLDTNLTQRQMFRNSKILNATSLPARLPSNLASPVLDTPAHTLPTQPHLTDQHPSTSSQAACKTNRHPPSPP